MNKDLTILLVILITALLLCCCMVIILGGAYSFLHIDKVLPSFTVNLPISSNRSTPTPFEITRQPADQIPTQTLKRIEQMNVPENDPSELACRFKEVCDVPPTSAPPGVPYMIGARNTFWVLNDDTITNFQVNATLKYITPHSYFWVADGVQYGQSEITNLMDTFENKIYPTDREFFGSEWTPGVDDDPHIYILYTGGLSTQVAGYFSSPDEYPSQIFQYSNVHEMFYISSSEFLSDSYTYGNLAHEFQHMIHWYQDRNENSFLNEGFSELASFLNGYFTGGFDQIYLANPDLNLTNWLGGSGDNAPHYGASYLFVTYFLDRFGEGTTKALIHNQQNGLDSIDGTLAQSKLADPSTGKVITADDFFLDWTITNFIQDASVGDGRYVYHNLPSAPQAKPTETIGDCPMNTVSRTVNQYGVDYIRINCQGKYSLSFEGSTSTHLLPADPHSGNYDFWSNKGDDSDMTLTRTFDLTSVTGPVSMDYWTWYDIEKDYDYVYVEASSDGQHWTILKTPSGTDSNPSGSSYGWGYTGQSNGWIQESVDLSAFAGQNVSIRFEYLTDPAVNNDGFLVDDISIPAIQYSTDFETEDDSWQDSGFVRIENTLPQTFRLALITRMTSGKTVQIIPISENQSAEIPLIVGQNGVQDVVLVVTGTTRFTTTIAPYQISIH